MKYFVGKIRQRRLCFFNGNYGHEYGMKAFSLGNIFANEIYIFSDKKYFITEVLFGCVD